MTAERPHGEGAPGGPRDERSRALHAAIAALESQRATLGDALVDRAAAPLRAELAHIAPLDAQPPPAASARRLRQVSVLFCDIVGSTRLSERLDPEDLQAAVDGALAAFAAIVARHGGEVLRYTGDNLKAAFGARGASDDDAERAVTCGLALLHEAARRGEALRRTHGHEGFAARAGLHTGPVVRGGGVEQDNSLTGLAVNIAARLEQTADPGTLRISVDTYRLVQGLFDVQVQPAMQVKGLQEPLRSFVVLGVRERRLRGLRQGAEGLRSPMVGRADELGRLLRLAAAVCAPGAGLKAATVLGEAGLGKSRLLAEWQAALPAAGPVCDVWRVASHPQLRDQPYGLLRDLLFWRLGVSDGDSQAQAQARLADGLAPVFGDAADEQTALLGQLVGLDYTASPHIAHILRDVRQLRTRGLNAWVRLIRQQAAVQPLALVLDDLQWADDASLAALDHLVSAAPGLPVLLLCAARPELLQRRPGWGAQWPGHERLDLAPLDAAGKDALAAALTSRFADPVPALQALLREQAAGNPFYMEALLQMLVDTRVVETEGPHWRLRHDGLADLKVPPTLVGVLQATLDALEAGPRRSLQQASVVGAQFWDEALAAIDASSPDELPVLSRRGLALPQAQSSFDGATEYGFRHHLLHQVTYGTVLKDEKRAAHGQVARWLQERGRGRESELASQIAEHFERAGDRPQALRYWTRAAEEAARREADVLALAHADRALALDDGSDPRRRVTLHQVRAAVFLRASKSVEHRQEVATLEALAEQLDDGMLRLTTAYGRAWLLVREARYEDAIRLCEGHVARGEVPAETARLLDTQAVCLARLGRVDEALAHVQLGLAQARAAGESGVEGNILNNAGVHHMEADRLGQALDCYHQAIAAYRLCGNRHGALAVSLNLAVIEESVGRYEASRDRYFQVLRECDETGALGLKGLACANLAGVLAELGDGRGGRDTAMEGLRLARVSADRRTEAFALRGARMAAAVLGQWHEALVHGREAATALVECGYPAQAWTEAARVARTLSEQGDTAAALDAVQRLLAEVDAAGGWGDGPDAPFHVHRVLQAVGDARAAGLLAAAHQALSAQAERYADVVLPASFLKASQTAREICAAWARAQGLGATGPG